MNNAKKIMVTMLVAFGFATCLFAAETSYKVYDINMTLKTSKAGGVYETPCGDDYVYRVKGSRNIKGVIAGCGCLAMAGDPTCDNFVMYFWDATTKTQLTNVTFSTEILQRIDKNGKTSEHATVFVVEDQEGEKFTLHLAGFGTYKASKSGAKYDTVSVNGGVVGIVDAPYNTVRGSCSVCSSTPDVTEQTQALAACEDGTCTESDTSDVTPVYGTYSLKYNATKAKNCEKKGITKKTLGLPDYVNL